MSTLTEECRRRESLKVRLRTAVPFCREELLVRLEETLELEVLQQLVEALEACDADDSSMQILTNQCQKRDKVHRKPNRADS
jgi:hypothetical protein